jgi:hypothetical protein
MKGIITLVLLVAIVGCGKDDSPAPPTTTLPPDVPTTTLPPVVVPPPAPSTTEFTVKRFVPSEAKPLIKKPLRTEVGKHFDRVEVSMKVRVGKVHSDEGALQSLFWLQRGHQWNPNVYMYANLKKPGLMKLSSNTNQPKKVMNVDDAPFSFKEGDVLDVEAVYTRNGKATLVINGKSVSVVIGAQSIVRTKRGMFRLEIGFKEGEAGPERPSYGWEYSDILVKFL